MIYAWSIFDPSSWYSTKFVSLIEFVISTIKSLIIDLLDWFFGLPGIFTGLYSSLPTVIRPFVIALLGMCVLFFLWFAISKIIELF